MVEIAGRLIRQHQFGLIGQGPCDGDALLLSAGELPGIMRQAVARALANKPKLVLADEPTGNLDHKNARESLALIREACHESGAALLLVSHAREVLAQFEDVREFSRINQTEKAEALLRQ